VTAQWGLPGEFSTVIVLCRAWACKHAMSSGAKRLTRFVRRNTPKRAASMALREPRPLFLTT